jgi:transcription factor C subunit 7
MTWSVDPYTIQYFSGIPTPTGIPTDPALTSYGEAQADQLGDYVLTLQPPVDQVFSSPYYRCLQTIRPAVEKLQKQKGYNKGITVENGFEEWFGATGDHRTHPRPATVQVLRDHFQHLNLHLHPEGPAIVPAQTGETVDGLHDRVAYALHKTIERADNAGFKSIIICSHAAAIIAIGRALTGEMPEDYTKEDFYCFTAGLSQYRRRNTSPSSDIKIASWTEAKPEDIPDIEWRGLGVKGGWDCIENSQASYLKGGAERGWKFSGDESFLKDPNGFNDGMNEMEAAEKLKTSML